MANIRQKSIFNRLKTLFSNGGLVIRNIGNKNFNVIDTNMSQGDGNQSLSRDRFSKLYSSMAEASYANSITFGGSGYGIGQNSFGMYGTQQQNIEFQRNKIYVDYELMDKDPIISSAFDILADEATVKNEYNEIIQIKTEDADVKEALNNLFYNVLNVDTNLTGWARNLVKYGDFYLALDVMAEFGIVNAHPLSQYFMYRFEGYSPENPYETKYKYDLGGGKSEEFDFYEIAHFRMTGDANFLPYGKSFAENARFIYKQLYLMEEAMLIHRITRAPEKRVFKIDVGNLSPEDIELYMRDVVKRSKKTPLVEDDGQYNMKYNMQNILEDFYIPLRGGHSGAEIENLSGLEYNAIEDIEYLLNKLFAALKVPKTYLSYEADVEGKATLAAEDVKFAKTIQRIQNVLISELTKLAMIHLYIRGFTNEQLGSFKIEMTNPSIIFEKERMELLSLKSDLATNLYENKWMSRDKIYKVIFGLTEEETKQEEMRIINDAKTKFRLMQIEDEGNDPAVTGESFGTAHDIAAMHVSSKNEGGSEEGGQPGAGRPAKVKSTYGTHKSTFGRDPVGNKDLFKSIGRDTNLRNNFRSSSPLSYESIKPLKVKDKKIITESLKEIKMDDEEVYKNTYMDESNLIFSDD